MQCARPELKMPAFVVWLDDKSAKCGLSTASSVLHCIKEQVQADGSTVNVPVAGRERFVGVLVVMGGDVMLCSRSR
jgi:hypothetical protein